MECREAQFFLRFRRPGAGDLGPDEAVALDRHLAACPHCAADARLASAFDAAIGTAMRDVSLPHGLRDRLIASAAAHRGTVLRRKLYQTASIAASLLLAVGIGIGVLTATRPQPDIRTLALNADTLATTLMAGGQPVNFNRPITDPEVARANEQAVNNWLASEHLPPGLPERFDYGLLLSYHWEEVQGRKVPVIWFGERNGPGFAKVYIFRSSQFDLKDVREDQSSYCRALPLAGGPPGLSYVVVFTGQDLTPFLQGHGGRVVRNADV